MKVYVDAHNYCNLVLKSQIFLIVKTDYLASIGSSIRSQGWPHNDYT